MARDITAYSRLTRIGEHADEWCEDDRHVQVWAYDTCPDSFRGIPVLRAERQGSSPRFLIAGCYSITPVTQTYSFQVGSYTDHNVWRSDLQRQFNPSRDRKGPFYELICFPINGGCIGPDAARDLLADFEQHVEKYDPQSHPKYAREQYRDWWRACQLAANAGLIHFH